MKSEYIRTIFSVLILATRTHLSYASLTRPRVRDLSLNDVVIEYELADGALDTIVADAIDRGDFGNRGDDEDDDEKYTSVNRIARLRLPAEASRTVSGLAFFHGSMSPISPPVPITSMRIIYGREDLYCVYKFADLDQYETSKAFQPGVPAVLAGDASGRPISSIGCLTESTMVYSELNE